MINPLYNYKALVMRVVDADTLDLRFDMGFNVAVTERVRLARIDAWETRGPEREQGLVAKHFVVEATFQEWLLVATGRDKGKWGRWIAEIWLPNGSNLSDLLVAFGHAEYREY